ncbi:MAG: response regulator [Oscillospiraceae bacterium]|jgi:signal transduction histidine kinase|nr:response regulator [Oscillospiraceae bacterium]
MKKFNLLYIIVLFAVLLVVQNFLILRAVHEMSGDARVVNYSGLVRGATQRLVKLELSYRENDALMATLEEYLYGLAGDENDYNIAFMPYEPFQASVSDLLIIWEELKTAISDYRAGNTTAEALLEVSERHFAKADEATHNAEYGSEGKLGGTELLIRAGIAAISVIVLIVAVFLYLLRRSERRQMELLQDKNRQLESAILEANEANRAKSTFLSHMSHDIRTPLNGIIGMTAIAAQNVTNPERVSDCLRKIDSSSRLLHSLVNDVLDMSKIESGKFNVNIGEINLSEFSRNLVNILTLQAGEKRQELRVPALSLTHEHILGDQLRLNQLFMNILSNSVKFTPEGGVIGFTVKELPCGREGFASYEFVCCDTGIGMAREYLQHIFESFSREKDSRIDKIEGSGLGLSITKRIVDMMGGKIEVESEKNQGTRVTVTLDFPVYQPDAAPGAPSEPAVNPEPETALRLDGVRVLMAEDNDLNTEIAVAMLSVAGVLLDCAENGKVAVEMFNNSEPNTYAMILMDMQMPVMTGCEAAAAIRALPRPDAGTVPIIAMTANAFEEDVREALSAGMNAHVPKPVHFEQLKAVMKGLL